MIAPLSVKKFWRIWVNALLESAKSSYTYIYSHILPYKYSSNCNYHMFISLKANSFFRFLKKTRVKILIFISDTRHLHNDVYVLLPAFFISVQQLTTIIILQAYSYYHILLVWIIFCEIMKDKSTAMENMPMWFVQNTCGNKSIIKSHSGIYIWCRELTTCLLHVGPPFGNRILNNSWAVVLT